MTQTKSKAELCEAKRGKSPKRGEHPKYSKVFITAHHHNVKCAGTSWSRPSRSNQFMHVFFHHRNTAFIFSLSFFVLVICSYIILSAKLLSLILTSNS